MLDPRKANSSPGRESRGGGIGLKNSSEGRVWSSSLSSPAERKYGEGGSGDEGC